MKISVITPTEERRNLVQGTFQLLQKQTHVDWEWLVYDTSLTPLKFTDPRVIYLHDEAIVSIGEKRNRLIEKASGDLVVHFDDDDYYSPYYLENCVRRLQESDFFTFSAWFSYDIKTSQFYYWDTQQRGEFRYSVDALSGARVREIDFGPYMKELPEKINDKGRRGYGFSYAYTKEVAKHCTFLDIDCGEDRHFSENVFGKGYKCTEAADESGEVVHVIHYANTSTEFPQYRVPHFLVKNLFPPFFPYVKNIHEN